MKFALVVSVLFFAAAVMNTIDEDFPNAIAGVLISFVFTSVYVFNIEQEKRKQEFTDWLLQNKEKLKTNPTSPLQWNGSVISHSFPMTQYQMTLFFLFMTSRYRSGFIFQDNPKKTKTALASSLLTLLVGWWGIPFGPICSIQTFYRNARGGCQSTVGASIAE